MDNTPPLVSPLDQTRPVTLKGPTAYRLPEAATAAFEHYFVNVAHNVKKPKIDEWVEEYGLKVESIRQWFARRRNKLKSGPNATATRSVSSPRAQSTSNLPNLPHQPHDNDDSDEQAAKQEFGYLVEEKILRLLAYFKDRRLNIKHLSELAEQLGVPPQVVIDFARWKALREVAHLGNEIVSISLQGTPNNNPVSPTRSTPLASEPQRSASILSVKMEVDEAAASLPTPQPSVGMSPSPSRTQSIEPDSTYVSFYDTWLSARVAPLETSTTSSIVTQPSSILQKHLPPSIAQFAFGSPNAT